MQLPVLMGTRALVVTEHKLVPQFKNPQDVSLHFFQMLGFKVLLTA